jgi:general transcription factor IIIA
MGYEESGRNIECVVDNCDYRFVRIYDLKVHLRSLKHHGFDEGQVEELIIDAEGGRREENGEYNENDDEDEDEMTDTDSSGSGSDEESDVIADGMEYVNLWDDMGDMDLDKESGDVSGEE